MEKFISEVAVSKQYASSTNLEARMLLHNKYSVNPQGLFPWLLEQYVFPAEGQVLEAGCGTGALWQHTIKELPSSLLITLTDHSQGMVEKVQTNLVPLPNLFIKQMDIQHIPYEDHYFDVIIANMMLYHVPDLNRALAEISRVLKPGGTFYCATNSKNGIDTFLQEHLGTYGAEFPAHKNFTLENGQEVLQNHFSFVELRMYEDALAVTNTQDLVNYIRSMEDIATMPNLSDSMLFDLFEKEKKDGAIHISKKAGTFVCKKQ